MKVRDVMLRDLTSVDPGDTRDLGGILEMADVSSVPVTDNDDRLVGVASERDVLASALPKYMEFLHSVSFVPNLDREDRTSSRAVHQSTLSAPRLDAEWGELLRRRF